MSRVIKCDRCGHEVDPKKIGYVSIMQRSEAGDGAESCKQKGRAESFRHILAMEYGEDIYERGNENRLL